MKPNPLRRLLALFIVVIAAMAIAAPVAIAGHPVISDDPSKDARSVPTQVRSTQGKAKTKKRQRVANQRPKRCPGNDGRTLARVQGCVR
jgi:hypothetical protein